MELLEFFFNHHWEEQEAEEKDPALFDSQQVLNTCVLICNVANVFANGLHGVWKYYKVHHAQAEWIQGQAQRDEKDALAA